MYYIVFISGNSNKAKELNSILGNDFIVKNYKIDLPEIQSIDVKEVILEKIKYCYNILNKEIIVSLFDNKIDINDIIIICEDTGLYIKNMNYFPGALIKFYYESIGNKGIIQRDANSYAYIICCIGIIYKDKIYTVSAKVKGNINNKYNNIQGFGWDEVFIPKLKEKYNKYINLSYAEIPIEFKNKISHRAKVIKKFKKFIYNMNN